MFWKGLGLLLSMAVMLTMIFVAGQVLAAPGSFSGPTTIVGNEVRIPISFQPLTGTGGTWEVGWTPLSRHGFLEFKVGPLSLT